MTVYRNIMCPEKETSIANSKDMMRMKYDGILPEPVGVASMIGFLLQ